MRLFGLWLPLGMAGERASPAQVCHDASWRGGASSTYWESLRRREEVAMKRREVTKAAAPESVVESVARQRPKRRRGGHDHGALESVRHATYRGHEIVIRTSYSIEVDGTPIEGHVGVTNDGRVHYHAVPNLSFTSAVDLAKQLIDTFPDDFAEVPGHHHEEP
ncbi:MAG: hypothetical protein M3P53_00920 [Actinomycetota bacterium]|nr:hypothetical protein [Actinomycetota bacterium]